MGSVTYLQRGARGLQWVYHGKRICFLSGSLKVGLRV